MTPTVLLLGGTGRTGGRVLQQLLDRGVSVRAIVRDRNRLPDAVSDRPQLTVVEADLHSMPTAGFRDHLRGCDTVISCLGHNISLRGVLGPPRDLVQQAVRVTCTEASALEPSQPVHVILMSSVSVNQPEHADSRRGGPERAFLWLIRQAVPPAKDNQRAADYLTQEVGTDNPYVEWVAVRPDTLKDGDVTEYRTSPELTASVFRPDQTNMANVAHFMCELATDAATWKKWRFRMPVITNAAGPDARSA